VALVVPVPRERSDGSLLTTMTSHGITVLVRWEGGQRLEEDLLRQIGRSAQARVQEAATGRQGEEGGNCGTT
jgi:hypothetical protein